jgi:hypothetical protein
MLSIPVKAADGDVYFGAGSYGIVTDLIQNNTVLDENTTLQEGSLDLDFVVNIKPDDFENWVREGGTGTTASQAAKDTLIHIYVSKAAFPDQTPTLDNPVIPVGDNSQRYFTDAARNMYEVIQPVTATSFPAGYVGDEDDLPSDFWDFQLKFNVSTPAGFAAYQNTGWDIHNQKLELHGEYKKTDSKTKDIVIIDDTSTVGVDYDREFPDPPPDDPEDPTTGVPSFKKGVLSGGYGTVDNHYVPYDGRYWAQLYNEEADVPPLTSSSYSTVDENNVLIGVGNHYVAYELQVNFDGNGLVHNNGLDQEPGVVTETIPSGMKLVEYGDKVGIFIDRYTGSPRTADEHGVLYSNNITMVQEVVEASMSVTGDGTKTLATDHGNYFVKAEDLGISLTYTPAASEDGNAQVRITFGSAPETKTDGSATPDNYKDNSPAYRIVILLETDNSSTSGFISEIENTASLQYVDEDGPETIHSEVEVTWIKQNSGQLSRKLGYDFDEDDWDADARDVIPDSGNYPITEVDGKSYITIPYRLDIFAVGIVTDSQILNIVDTLPGGEFVTDGTEPYYFTKDLDETHLALADVPFVLTTEGLSENALFAISNKAGGYGTNGKSTTYHFYYKMRIPLDNIYGSTKTNWASSSKVDRIIPLKVTLNKYDSEDRSKQKPLTDSDYQIGLFYSDGTTPVKDYTGADAVFSKDKLTLYIDQTEINQQLLPLKLVEMTPPSAEYSGSQGKTYTIYFTYSNALPVLSEDDATTTDVTEDDTLLELVKNTDNSYNLSVFNEKDSDYGKLSVTKTVTAGDNEKVFTFYLKTGEPLAPFNGSFTVTGDDAPTGTQTTSTEGAFTLKHGQTAHFNILKGTPYQVVEADYSEDGYITYVTGTSGTINAAELTAAFENVKTKPITPIDSPNPDTPDTPSTDTAVPTGDDANFIWLVPMFMSLAVAGAAWLWVKEPAKARKKVRRRQNLRNQIVRDHIVTRRRRRKYF